MRLLGLLLVVAGIAAGLYVGVYLCLVGGIVDIVEQFKAPEMEGMAIAWGVVKIVFAGAAGWLSALLLVIPGFGMLSSSSYGSRFGNF